MIKFIFDEDLPVISHGHGVFVYDTNGRAYLDACSGAAAVNLGHGDPQVLKAMSDQAERITFANRGAFHNEPSERLADRLSALTGYPYVFLCNSGSEAVETALRLTLQYWQECGQPQRSHFLSHAVSYHGATLGGLSLSGHPQRRRVAKALLHGFNELIPPYAYRFAQGRDDVAFSSSLLDDASRTLDAYGAGAAGVVVEPVGGAAGGAITPPDGYLPGLAALCRERDVPLIADEIMCGIGRTGTMLASEHWSIRPDMVVVGKGLGAGYAPVSAVLISRNIIDTIAAGTASVTGGHTYGCNPLGSAVALAALDAIESRGLVDAAAERGSQLRAGLEDLRQRHDVIGEVRGLGLLQGLELVSDRETRNPGDPIGSLTHTLIASARDQGLLLYPVTGGINDAVLVAPPLVTSAEEIDLLLRRLDAALTAMRRTSRCRT
ncbi:aminotransferase class III-fold pyridoxal phosphate-dependent enzyme [Streptomyces coffeae]|uniref:Aminotransferase class III-fold pyridoxal phosphate-dependent enzyme n=1 Tax=Streptomyces coffeae TaxID=621382 RepID=A0ABS1NR61_9ACTN|nr:aminotransferase class III-fold pyridoxal phosphate-dependent enzyme [Streptomyces coffeae]MBL1102591.1 aminotransferase class III-fold pyridoxal phosphate-dependent enzyme [Streptomyces coffeae]